MGWPERATPLLRLRLERELRSHFQNAVARLVQRDAKGRRLRAARAASSGRALRAGNDLAQIVETELQIVVAVGKRRQAVIQEIKCRELELETLPLSQFKGLHRREIAVPKHGTRHIRQTACSQNSVPIRRKALGIGKLFRLQSLGGIAGNYGIDGDVGRPQDGDVTLPGSPIVEVQTVARRLRAQLCATLNLGDAGNLPTVTGSTDQRLPRVYVRQAENVGSAKRVCAIERQDTPEPSSAKVWKRTAHPTVAVLHPVPHRF